MFRERLTLEDAANDQTADPNDTDLKPQVNNLVALVTKDDYTMRFTPGSSANGMIDRVGFALGPLEGPLQPQVGILMKRLTVDCICSHGAWVKSK